MTVATILEHPILVGGRGIIDYIPTEEIFILCDLLYVQKMSGAHEEFWFDFEDLWIIIKSNMHK